MSISAAGRKEGRERGREGGRREGGREGGRTYLAFVRVGRGKEVDLHVGEHFSRGEGGAFVDRDGEGGLEGGREGGVVSISPAEGGAYVEGGR